MTYKIRIFLLSASVLTLFSCNTNIFDVDVSGTTINIKAYDVDSLYRNTTLDKIKMAHHYAVNNFSDLYEMEMSYNLRAPLDSNFTQLLYAFYNSEYITKVEKEKKEKFTDKSAFTAKIKNGLQYLKFHFPDQIYPNQILWMNNLFAGVHSSDSAISVGLEYYLGANNKVVQTIPTEELYVWQRQLMKVEYLERDVLESWIQAHFIEELDGKLIEHIVQAGKTLYLVNACFPNENDTIIVKYTQEQLTYAEENIELFWEYLIDQKLLFQNNPRDKSNFLNAGPYTVGLPEEAPDRLGQYLGFMMVKTYMSKNQISLQELLKTDYNKILQAFELD